MGSLVDNTVRVTLTDSSQLLTAIMDTALGKTVNWDIVVSATITCESNDCRVAFGVAASTTVGHILAADQSLRIPSANLVKTARLINKTVGSNAVIQVTLEG